MTRSDIRFPNLEKSFPSDTAQILTAWDIAGTPYPTTGEGQFFGEHTFPGTSGYTCTDVTTDYTGLPDISPRFIGKPDYGAMDGGGRKTLIARGDGSLVDLNQAHPWGFAIRITGSTIEWLGYYQDGAFVVNEVIIGSSSIPADQSVPIVAGFSREVMRDLTLWRVSVNGTLIGEVNDPIIPLSVPESNILTIGYRNNNGTPAEFYEGTIEGITVLDRATTAEEENAEYQTRLEILQSQESIPRRLVQPMQEAASDPDDPYHKLRIKPWSQLLGDIHSNLKAAQSNGIYKPFGPQLDAWISALGLENRVGQCTLAEKQDLVQAVMTDPGTFTEERLRQIVADLTKTDIADVDLFENQNHIFATATASPSQPSTGIFSLCGHGTADLTVSGILLNAKAGRDMSWNPAIPQMLYNSVAIEHTSYTDLNELSPEDGLNAEIYGFGFAATLVSIAAAGSSTEWSGITLTGRTSIVVSGNPIASRAFHIGVYDAGPNFTLAWRTSGGFASGASYSDWTVLGTIAVGNTLSVEYNRDNIGTDGPEFTVRVNTSTVTDEYPISLPNDRKMPIVTRAGFSIQSEGILANDLLVVWDEPLIHYPRSPVGRDYTLSADTTTVENQNHAAHTAVIRENQRPVSQGFVTYTDEFELDDPAGPLDYTRMSSIAASPPALADSSAIATHNSGIKPHSLWTFQGPGTTNFDRLGRDTFTAGGAGGAVVFESTGSDGRDSVFVSEDDTENYLQLGHINSLNFGTFTDTAFVMVYKWDADNPTDNIVMQKTQTLGARLIKLSIPVSDFVLDIADGIGGTASINVPATSAAWDVMAFSIENTTGTTYRLTMANRTANATVTQALGTSMFLSLPWEIGASNTLMPARINYRWLLGATNGEASNLSGTDLEAVCARVYGSIFGG